MLLPLWGKDWAWRWLKVSFLNQGGKFWLLKGTTKTVRRVSTCWLGWNHHPSEKTHHAILNGNGNLSTSWNWVNVFSPQEKHSWSHLITYVFNKCCRNFHHIISRCVLFIQITNLPRQQKNLLWILDLLRNRSINWKKIRDIHRLFGVKMCPTSYELLKWYASLFEHQKFLRVQTRHF